MIIRIVAGLSVALNSALAAAMFVLICIYRLDFFFDHPVASSLRAVVIFCLFAGSYFTFAAKRYNLTALLGLLGVALTIFVLSGLGAVM